MKVTRQDGSRMIIISWDGAVTSSWPGLVYEVSLGAVQGGANILNKKLTANTSTQLRLSLSRDRDVGVFVTIVAIDKCGNTATLEDHFVVSL